MLLEVNDLGWSKGKKDIFNHITLNIEEGSRVGLVGPNGCGKSSLLKVLAFLEQPTSGEIIFKSKNYGRQIPLNIRRNIGIVLQEPLLFNNTVYNNVAMGLQIRGVPRLETIKRVQDWLGHFKIAHLEHQQARTLSGGEAQRVSLARAFVLEPEILFMDEPFSALDAPTKDQLMSDLTQILAVAKTTVIFVSHSFREIRRMTERAIIMINGRIVAEAAPDELLTTPQDVEVAAFLKHWQEKNYPLGSLL